MQQAREFFFKFFHHDALLRAGIPRGALTYIRKTKKKSKKSDIGEEGKLTPPPVRSLYDTFHQGSKYKLETITNYLAISLLSNV